MSEMFVTFAYVVNFGKLEIEMRHSSCGLLSAAMCFTNFKTGWERDVQSLVQEMDFQLMLWWLAYGERKLVYWSWYIRFTMFARRLKTKSFHLHC